MVGITEDLNPIDINFKRNLTNKILASSGNYNSFDDFMKNYSFELFNDEIGEKIENLCGIERSFGNMVLKKYNLENVLLKKAISKRSFFNRTFVKDMIYEIDEDINSFFRDYKLNREKGLNHAEGIKEILLVKKNSLIKTFDEADFVIDFAPGYLRCKKVPRVFEVWDSYKFDRKNVSDFINTSFSKNYFGINKMKTYEVVLVEIAEKFGRKMSLSTMYKYLDKKFKKKRNSAFIERELNLVA